MAMSWEKIEAACSDLPVWEHRADFLSVVERGANLVYTAKPGTGKSTVLPLVLAHGLLKNHAKQGGSVRAQGSSRGTGQGSGQEPGSKVLVLQPRRLAAMALARRLASILGEEPGQTVGWRTGLDTMVGPHTQIEIITEGILARMISHDPELPGVGAVVFDEFHERSLHGDLGLHLCLESKDALRPDLSLVVMSATMEPGPLLALLGPGTIHLNQDGTTFPVSITHQAPPPGLTWWKSVGGFCSWVAQVITTNLAQGEAIQLVFLPGHREISAVAQELPRDIDLIILHSSSPASEQARIYAPLEQQVVHQPTRQHQSPMSPQASRPHQDSPSPKRSTGTQRVILSTTIAETSLTIPGVTMVVDGGLSRFVRFDSSLGFDRLVTERVSRFGATQRSGRAGRLGPGRCIRLWDPQETLPPIQAPETETADLAGFALLALSLGTKSMAGLRVPSPPSVQLWTVAVELLSELGLIEATPGGGVQPTILGLEVAKLPLHPRLGAVICQAPKDSPLLGGALWLAAWFMEGFDKLREASATGDFTTPDTRVTERHGKLCRLAGAKPGSPHGPSILEAMALAFPDRLAHKEGQDLRQLRYQLVGGRICVQGLRPGLDAQEWILVLDAEAGESSSIIRASAPVSPEVLDIMLSHKTTTPRITWNGLIPRITMQERLGALVLKEWPGDYKASSTKKALLEGFLDLLAQAGLAVLPWTDEATQLLHRMRYFAVHGGLIPLPSDQELVQQLAQNLGSYLSIEAGRPILSSEALEDALSSLIPWELKKDFERATPSRLTLPGGRSKPLMYGPLGSEQVSVSILLQDTFGLDRHPMVGQRPILLHLLSPARRPLQSTSDILGFWDGSYQEIRKEMRGRYPKHRWPENPRDFTQE